MVYSSWVTGLSNIIEIYLPVYLLSFLTCMIYSSWDMGLRNIILYLPFYLLAFNLHDLFIDTCTGFVHALKVFKFLSHLFKYLKVFKFDVLNNCLESLKKITI
jgi:hypothetical protein